MKIGEIELTMIKWKIMLSLISELFSEILRIFILSLQNIEWRNLIFKFFHILHKVKPSY